MNTEKRLRVLKEMAERNGLEIRVTHPSQREPESIISLYHEESQYAPLVRVTSRDGIAVALGKMEAHLLTLTGLASDLYFRHPHRWMGRV